MGPRAGPSPRGLASGIRVRAKHRQAGSLPCPEAGEEIWLQQDGASPHTAKANKSVFTTQGKKHGFMIKVRTQPARSPDLNVNDLAFFRSLKCDVRSETMARSKDEFTALVERMHEEYDAERMERGWRCLIDVYRQILENGGKVTQPRHHDLRKRQREGLPADCSLTGGQAFAQKRLRQAERWFAKEGYESESDSDSDSDGGEYEV